MAWRLIMTVARVMQAVVENISWHDTRLAHDSIAGVACPVLAVKTWAIGSSHLLHAEPRCRERSLCFKW